MNRRVRIVLALTLLGFVSLVVLSGLAGYRAWSARQPHVLEGKWPDLEPVAISVGRTGLVACFGVESGLRLHSLDSGKLIAHLDDPAGLQLTRAVLAPSGLRLATLSWDPSTLSPLLRLWDAPSRTVLWSVHLARDERPSIQWRATLAFCSESEHVLVGDHDGAKVFSVATGKLERSFASELADSPEPLALLPGCQHVAGKVGASVRAFAFTTGECVTNFEILLDDMPVFFSPAGDLVASVATPGVALWALPSGREVVSHLPLGMTGARDHIAIATDGEVVVTGNENAVETQIELNSLVGRPLRVLQRIAGRTRCAALALAPDRDVAVVAYQGQVHVLPFSR